MVNPTAVTLNWAKTQYAGEILDFSVNCNPLGTPRRCWRRPGPPWKNAGCYPDPACTELRLAIAAMDGVTPEVVFCGSGAAEVIFRLALSLRPRAALLTAPGLFGVRGGRCGASAAAAGSTRCWRRNTST